MYPDVGDRGSEGFKNESIGVVPNPYGMFGEMDNQFFITIGEESFYFRCFINLDVA